MQDQLQDQNSRLSDFEIQFEDIELKEEEHNEKLNQIQIQMEECNRSHNQKIENQYQIKYKMIKKTKDNNKKTYLKLINMKQILKDEKQKQMNDIFNSKIQQIEEIKKERQEWEQEKLIINKIGAIGEDIVQLSVRGETKGFTVSKSLLRSVPGSKLDSMFSGKFKLQQLDGRYFLDLDPKIFRYILQFLSNGLQIPLIESKETEQQFKSQIDYLGLISKSQVQIDLENIFKTKPKNLNKKQEEIWSKLGPFDLNKYIKEGKIQMNPDTEIQNGSKQDSKNKMHDYHGQIQDGLLNGIGQANFNGEQILEGNFVKGTLDRFVRIIYESGNYYIGKFKNNKCHGKGKYVSYDGKTYDGIWIKDKFEDDFDV